MRPVVVELAIELETSAVADTVVQMIGRSSIAWTMISVYPAMATGAGVGAITLSTT